MKSYTTLGGFVSGHEPEGIKPRFAHYAILRISSPTGLDTAALEAQLQLQATTQRRKGDNIGVSGRVSNDDVWIYRAPVPEDQDLKDHIDALWRALQPRSAYLLALREAARVQILLGYSSNIDHAGVSIPPTSLEIFTALGVDFALNIVVVTDDEAVG